MTMTSIFHWTLRTLKDNPGGGWLYKRSEIPLIVTAGYLCYCLDREGIWKTLHTTYREAAFKMFGGKRYFGLKGLRLNIAIGALAGIDFL